MGLQPAAASLLLDEARRRPFSGSVATLGRQHVYFTYDMLAERAARARVKLAPGPITLHREPMLARQGFLSDDSFLATLGFSHCVRIDVSDYEASEEIFDLNADETPLHLVGRFDVVLDTGTLEHVFHVPNALKHLYRLVKPGGRIIHNTPASNHLDHGFWMFSPTLFQDYYAANGFEINAIRLVRFTPRHTSDPWLVYDYTPGYLTGDVMWGGLDDAMYSTFVVVTKTPGSTCDRIPQQGWYLRRWGESPDSAGAEPGKAAALLRRVEGSRLLTLAAKGLIRSWRATEPLRKRIRRKGLGLKPVARY